MLHSRSRSFRWTHSSSVVWFVCLAILLPAAIRAVDGTLDTSFGTAGTGLVLTDFGGVHDNACGLAIQSDGKIVVAGTSDASGSYDFALARYNADGTLDTSFGNAGTGLVLTDFSGKGSYDVASAMGIQSDGKIVVAGTNLASGTSNYNFALARYNPDGTLDTSFGNAGSGLVVTDLGSLDDEAFALAIQNDGKILAAGLSGKAVKGFGLARYNPDGTLDTSFGNAGTVVGTGAIVEALAIQSNGKIIAAGFGAASSSIDFALMRLNPNGTVDTSFGTGGTGLVLTDFSGAGSDDMALALAIQNDAKILAAGLSDASGNLDFALARYNADGTLDPSFGIAGTGRVLTDFGGSFDGAGALAIQSDGKILAAGQSNASGNNDFVLARYRPDGMLDPTFGTAGTGFVLTDFSGAGSDDAAAALAIQSDGKILAAGQSDASGGNDFALARYSSAIPVFATPTLDDYGLAFLALLLAAAALFATGRASGAKDRVG